MKRLLLLCLFLATLQTRCPLLAQPNGSGVGFNSIHPGWLYGLRYGLDQGRDLLDLQKEHLFDVTAYPYLAIPDDAIDDTTAIQAAITACAAAGYGKVFVPSGRYILSAPLVMDDGLWLEGVPGLSILEITGAGEAALDATSLAENISGVIIDGIVFDPSAAGCYGIKGPTAPTYYLTATIRNCDFYADLTYGIYGMLAFCEIAHCNFGRSGTAGAISQSIVSLGASGKSTFTNRISFCWFEDTTDCHAAVEFRVGNTLLFDTCVWQVLSTPAVKVISIQQVTFDNCNFEHIDPNSADANDVVVDLNVDAALLTARYVYSEFRGCKFNQSSGSAAAMAYIGSGATAEFSRCKFNGDGSPYYSMRAGPVYDTLITRIWMCNTTGFASSISATSYWNTLLDLQVGMEVGNGAASSGYIDFREDTSYGTNIGRLETTALSTDRSWTLPDVNGVLGISPTQPIALTGNTVLTDANDGQWFTNDGAVDGDADPNTIIVVLPATTAGFRCGFVVVDANDIVIDPTGADLFLGGSGAGKYLRLDDTGCVVELWGPVETMWAVQSGFDPNILSTDTGPFKWE